MDGVDQAPANPELHPGDIVSLCAGACDGAGSGVFPLAREISLRISGGVTTPIVFQAFSGETVVVSGDANQNGRFDSGIDLVRFISTLGNPKSNYQWKNLIFEKAGGDDEGTFRLENPQNWIFDGVTVRENDSRTWGGRHHWVPSNQGSACGTGSGSIMMKVTGLTNGTFTMQNSRIHGICGFAHRNVQNKGGNAEFRFINNEYYNTGPVSVDWGNWDWKNNRGAKFTWQGNYMHDVGACALTKQETNGTVFEDNVCACLGEWQVSQDGRCAAGFHFGDGDTPECPAQVGNIIFKRNTIYSRVEGTFSDSRDCKVDSSQCGYFQGAPVAYEATCGGCAAQCCVEMGQCSSSSSVIENNMIWHHWTWSSDDCARAGICVDTNNSGVTVQNNTIYSVRYGIFLDGVGAQSYTVNNNLVVRAEKGSTDGTEVKITTAAAGSRFSNNNLHHGGRGGPVVDRGGTLFDCSQVVSFGTLNRCLSTSLLNVSGEPASWDLHLATAVADIVDGGTLIGPSKDFDDGDRVPPLDIGADEFGIGASVELTASVAFVSPPQPSRSIQVLKVGTYGLQITTSTDVVRIPADFVLRDSNGQDHLISLQGSVPGRSFTGTLVVDTSVAEQDAVFLLLDSNALEDSTGKTSNKIKSGNQVQVDRTPPAAPQGVAAN
jgi:hypothetical protein